MNITFDSCRDYFSFVFAKGFYDPKEKTVVDYPKNLLEKVGGVILAPAFTSTDQLLQNIKNPLVITALTLAAIAIVTIAFYPATFVGMIGIVIPFIWSIQPWMIQLAVYGAVQLNILALCLRTFGRLSNPSLTQAWTNRNVIPIAIGTQAFDALK